jgi:hypothetical protein
VEFNGYTIEPYYLLKYPIKARDTWQIEYPFQVGLTGIKGTVTVLGEEEVKVPAGTFKAVKLERVITEENGKLLAKPLKITVWFARGVGRVKVVPSEGTHLELLSFTPGNK